jgi:pilus assembly protein CpaC
MLHSPRRITIIGLQPGETDAVVLDSSGRTILSLRIRVDAGVKSNASERYLIRPADLG